MASGPGGGSTSVAARFWQTWDRVAANAADRIDLQPMLLARTCTDVLRVDGAAISVLADIRVPLGGSDDAAAFTERLQFTLGEGPCLEAVRLERPVLATADQVARRWPAFHEEMVDRTPYRSVVSMPIPVADDARGALDLYLVPPDPAGIVDLDDATVLAEQVSAVITQVARQPGDVTPGAGLPQPAWLSGPDTTRRSRVWIALGMLGVALDVAPPDALALLRSYALARRRLVDDVVDDLIHGDLGTDELR